MRTFCSIVIPVYNRAGVTRRCLDTILDEPPEAPFEIVVVDDGSTDSTQELLAGYGRRIKVVTHATNQGYATACNNGAAAAAGDFLIFLNNDTLPLPGWLDALVDYAEEHGRVAVVGSKLLFPDDTVQHAGVMINQHASPRHIYSGFPGDHPAVNKSRRFQVVTFACALIKRFAFEQLDGLDAAFRNCYEDVDFCFRLGQLGYEVHYCHESVLYHLESVSRGRKSEDDKHNARLLSRRWLERPELVRDDLSYYQDDNLLRIFYPDSYPLRVAVSPLLALDWERGAAEEKTKLLDARSRHVFRLLAETIRLTAHIADLELEHDQAGAEQAGRSPEKKRKAPPGTDLFSRIQEIEEQIHDLQVELASTLDESSNGAKPESRPFAPSPYLGYRTMLWKISETVRKTVPEGAKLAMVSDGDDELLELDGRQAIHFPQTDEGIYNGYPLDSKAAISALEDLRAKGVEYLVLPVTALWWLDHYGDFREHLARYKSESVDNDVCIIFSLAARRRAKK
jgi:GT2 family glycosyltransferase